MVISSVTVCSDCESMVRCLQFESMVRETEAEGPWKVVEECWALFSVVEAARGSKTRRRSGGVFEVVANYDRKMLQIKRGNSHTLHGNPEYAPQRRRDRPPVPSPPYSTLPKLPVRGGGGRVRFSGARALAKRKAVGLPLARTNFHSFGGGAVSTALSAVRPSAPSKQRGGERKGRFPTLPGTGQSSDTHSHS